MEHFLIYIAIVAIYLLPTIVAAGRHHHNGPAILTLNLFLGWTALGWIIALVWAFTEVHERHNPSVMGSVNDVPEHLRRDT